jgi:hypothetical protein
VDAIAAKLFCDKVLTANKRVGSCHPLAALACGYPLMRFVGTRCMLVHCSYYTRCI